MVHKSKIADCSWRCNALEQAAALAVTENMHALKQALSHRLEFQEKVHSFLLPNIFTFMIEL